MDLLRQLFGDTDLETLRAYYAGIARMTPQQRLEQAMRLTRRVRELTAAGVRLRHPDYTDEQVRLAVIRLTVGEECFRLHFPDVDIEP
jgi:hypothetical protein